MPLEFGAPMGVFNNVPFYSSHYESADRSRFTSRASYSGSTDDGTMYTGARYQCVEGARRYQIVANNVTFPDVGCAYEIFEFSTWLEIVERGATRNSHRYRKVPTLRCVNGGRPVDQLSTAAAFTRPIPGCLLIWHQGGHFAYTGHVAVVTEVVDHGQNRFGVRIAEQNYDDESWKGRNYSRELPATVNAETGVMTIGETTRGSRVMGWIAAATSSFLVGSPLAGADSATIGGFNASSVRSAGPDDSDDSGPE
jgi:glutathionylspermidine amidase/synthetase